MTEVARVFEYGDRPIRTVTVDGEPWFVARDVAAVLGLGNFHSSVSQLDDDERGLHSMETPGGSQDLAVVTEAGLYSLILRSRKPEARKFKRWITHEVLPAIRKTGRYGSEITRRELAQMVIEEADRADRAEALAAEHQRRLAIAAPKADYVDRYINPARDTYTLDVVAKQNGLTGQKLRDYLVARKVIFRRTLGQRWSRTNQRKEPEYQWLARAGYEPWFTAKDQPDAPRLHNGQRKVTLYVNPVGKQRIAELLERHPVEVTDESTEEADA